MGRPVSELHETVARRLRRRGQRYTTGRRDLVTLLAGTERPLAIPDLLDRDPELSQSSLYRNLQVLEHAGVVRRLVTTTDTGARFELAEDLTSHHHHLVCRQCGRIEDFEPSVTLEDALVELTGDEVADGFGGGFRGGFRADHHRLDLVGVCADCA